MKFVNVDLSSEFDDMSEGDSLFSIPHEECLGDEGCVFIKNLGLQQTVETRTVFRCLGVSPAFEVVRVRVVNFLLVLVEDLEF